MNPKTFVSLVAVALLAAVSGCTKKLETEVAHLKAQLAATVELQAKTASQLANVSTENQALRTRVAELEEQIRKSAPPPEFTIAGEVFIATRGGTSFKLGSVSVAFFTREEVERWVRERNDTQQQMLAKLEPLEKKAQADVDVAREIKDRMDNAESAAMSAHFKAAYDDPQRDEKRKRWTDAQEASRKATDDWLEKSKVLGNVRRDELNVLTGEFYFSTLPAAPIVVRTNSEGKFKASLRRGVDWVVAAVASRNVGSSTEHYHWVFPVESPRSESAEIMLSNDKLTTVKNGGSLIYTADY